MTQLYKSLFEESFRLCYELSKEMEDLRDLDEENEKMKLMLLATKELLKKHYPQDEMCAVCHENYEKRELEVTICGHCFHPGCIVTLTSCPLCRERI